MSHQWKYKIKSAQTGEIELVPIPEHRFVKLIDKGVIKANTLVQCPNAPKVDGLQLVEFRRWHN